MSSKIISVGGQSIGQIVVLSGLPKLAISARAGTDEEKVESVHQCVKEASMALFAKDTSTVYDNNIEMIDIATSIAHGILIEMKELGYLMDGKPDKPRCVYATVEEMVGFTMLLWTTFACDIVMPRSYPLTRAEVSLAMRDSLGGDDFPVISN